MCDHLQKPRHMPYMFHAFDLSYLQNSKEYDDDAEFDAFADKLHGNWYDLIAYN